jgi:hypothetical protein
LQAARSELITTNACAVDKIPFSVYEFFGYLVPGYLLIVAVDYVRVHPALLVGSPPFMLAAFWILFAYVLGHILAMPASWLLERVIATRWLGIPSVRLFELQSRRWSARLFPGYFRPLPHKLQERIRLQAAKHGVDSVGEELFLLAFGQVKLHAPLIARLQTFLNLYGFSRNIAFTSGVSAIIVFVGGLVNKNPMALWWSGIAAFCCIGMFYRYLKFFRQYSFELFVTFAALPERKMEDEDAN